MKRILPAICTVVALAVGLQSCTKSTVQPVVTTPPKTINVSGLFSETGNWSTLGVDSKAALQFAAEDINKYLGENHANFRLSVAFYDTKLLPNLAENDFKLAIGKGTRFIIGPQSSAELAAIAPSVDSAQTIVISQGSTAGSLAIAGDPIFRFCPSDKVESAAIAATIYKADIKGLVTVARDDAGNLGLQTSTGSNFKKDGGEIKALPAYSTTITDFTSVIASLKTEVNALAATNGMAHTAIYLASFDEGADLFTQAASDPVLSQVKWYGGDGVALSAVFTGNAAAANFAIKTGFFAPSFGLPVALKSKWEPIAARIKAQTNIDPDAFALAAYDAMWVIAKTLQATKGSTTDSSLLKSTFAREADAYTGVTGPTNLDAAGDRATGSFDYWGIVKAGSTYSWKVVGESE
jgi:branched-chain amino acid transport system substrate-binding protein